MYNATNDEYFIKNITRLLPEYELCQGKIVSHSQKPYIFGCGVYGEMVHSIFHLKWNGWIDNDSKLWGSAKEGMPILPPKDVPIDSCIWIANKYHGMQIYQQLISLGFSEEQIFNVGDVMYRLSCRQYFDLEALRVRENEVFIDAGSYDGCTGKLFYEWSRGLAKHIYSFEPDPINFVKVQKNLKSLIRVGKATVINAGVYSKNDKLPMFLDKTKSRFESLTPTSGTYVSVIALDEQPYSNEITFVKMDIEGSELEALKGMKKTMKEIKPKLAISLYHKPEDVYEIPTYIMDIQPSYKFYIRHYSLAGAETVLYAI